MSEETQDAEIEMVQKHVTELGEFWDNVSIFVSKHEEGTDRGTVTVNLGSGNYYARIGHVKDWIIKEDEETRIHQREAHED